MPALLVLAAVKVVIAPEYLHSTKIPGSYCMFYLLIKTAIFKADASDEHDLESNHPPSNVYKQIDSDDDEQLIGAAASSQSKDSFTDSDIPSIPMVSKKISFAAW